jgi:hypothetical protein
MSALAPLMGVEQTFWKSAKTTRMTQSGPRLTDPTDCIYPDYRFNLPPKRTAIQVK